MQMFKRLLLIVALFSLVSGCAKPPDESLEDTRAVVAHAYAAGAIQFAPGEYQLAKSALQAAELQVKNREYRKAELTLELAQRYSREALKLTIERKEQQAAEQQKVAAEKQRIELAKQRELKRQSELKKKRQQQQKKKKKIVNKPVPKKQLPVVKPELADDVEVQAGENLATIAARVEVYNDALLWPLIYKANRDQIKDPTEIFSGQILMIPRDKTTAEVEAARQEARMLKLF